MLFYEGMEAEEVNHTTWDDYILSESEMRMHSEIERTLRHHRECRGREWSCDKRCRLEFRSDTGLCRVALPGDNCFGTPITYKYTRDFELIRFPRELAVLSRYPRCWSHLAPIICTTFYRLCSRHFFVEKDERNNVMALEQGHLAVKLDGSQTSGLLRVVHTGENNFCYSLH
ncbi:hypothetical protein KIN20_017103 [Parelaphostrongylus tenuis]|uniref:Uncharacterized protein n=1 Tax=Parelaphostrongylus tenuis TaxID=148309 RepID=A0AAD5N0F9_PARTN|nr:hypothetical protein KIN20_017103 [Parelaphostrongylus tenuis]